GQERRRHGQGSANTLADVKQHRPGLSLADFLAYFLTDANNLLASAVAGALGACSLVLLSNVPGVLANPDDTSSFIRHIDDLEASRGVGRGRIHSKLEAASRALEAGVEAVFIGPAAADTPVVSALTGRCGTRITRRTNHA